MNTRRGFLKQLIKLGVGTAVLPSAITYARKWAVQEQGLLVPFDTSGFACTMRHLFAEQRTSQLFGLAEAITLKLSQDPLTKLWMMEYEGKVFGEERTLALEVVHGYSSSKGILLQ